MKKILTASLLALAAIAFAPPTASAKTFGLFTCGRCCKGCCLCIKPYNAFSPICFGNVCCEGCNPLCCCYPNPYAYGACPAYPAPFDGIPVDGGCVDGSCAAAPQVAAPAVAASMGAPAPVQQPTVQPAAYYPAAYYPAYYPGYYPVARPPMPYYMMGAMPGYYGQ